MTTEEIKNIMLLEMSNINSFNNIIKILTLCSLYIRETAAEMTLEERMESYIKDAEFIISDLMEYLIINYK